MRLDGEATSQTHSTSHENENTRLKPTRHTRLLMGTNGYSVCQSTLSYFGVSHFEIVTFECCKSRLTSSVVMPRQLAVSVRDASTLLVGVPRTPARHGATRKGMSRGK